MTAPAIPRAAGKALVASVAVVAVLVLTGCPKRAEVVAAEEAATQNDWNWRLVTDKETGCQYIIYNSRGMTPRIAADGRTHMGCKGTSHDR